MSDPSRADQTVLRPLDQANREPAERAYRWAVLGVHSLIKPLTHRDWREQSKLPQKGGIVVVANHISNVDPIVLAQYLAFSGRWGRFLAKSSLFDIPVVGRFLRASGQIPVRRNTRSAREALQAAIDAVRDGKAVVVYPEGTITADPELWPMAGKTGAARIAYATGAPIIPVGQWGAQDVMYGKKIEFPKLLPRKTIRLVTGDPVPLDPGVGDQVTSAMLVRTTERIMTTLTELVADLRGADPPAAPSAPVSDTGTPPDESGGS